MELQGAGADDTYNKAEIGDDNSVTAKVTLSAGTQVGDLLVVKDGAGTALFSGQVTAEMLKDGLNVEVPVSGSPSEVKVTAQVTDQAGNPSGIADDTAKVDNVAAPTPSVELQGAGADDTYNKAEIGDDNSVTAKVTLSAGTQVGDLLVVKDGAGTALFSGQVTAEMLKDGLNVEVPVSGSPSEVKVTAQVTDQAGNPSGIADDTAKVDNVAAPTPSVELQGAGADDTYNKAEIGDDNSVTAKVTLSAGTQVGDLLVVKDGAGTALFSGQVTAEMLKDGLNVEVPVSGSPSEVKVTAQVTDQAGNPSGIADDTAKVDNVAAPTPSVELQGAGADDTYNKAEIGDDNSVTAKVTLSAGTQVGDLLVVKDGAGTALFSGQVTAEMLKDGLNVEVPVSGSPSEVKVTAQVTDQAGNPSGIADDTAKVDNVAAPTPSVELQGAGADDTYNKAEIGDDNSVTAKVTLSAGTQVGDLLVVKDGAGTALFSGQVTAEMLKDGLNVEVPVSGSPSEVKVTAQVTDQAGNPSGIADDTAKVDNVAAPTPSVELQGAGADDTYNKAEIGDDNSVTAKVTLSAGTQVGDLLVVKDGAGTALFSGQVTAEMLKDGLNVEVPVSGSPSEVKVTAQVTDQAGNPSGIADDTAKVDVTATAAPTVTIVDDSNNDQLLSKGEIGHDQVQLQTEVNHGELTAGGKVTLTINNGDATSTVELKLVNGVLQLANGQPANGFTYNNGTISWTATTPADGKSLTVSATQTDKAGNESEQGSDTAKILPEPTIASDKVTVSEEALVGGVADSNGSDDQVTRTGELTIHHDGNGPVSVGLDLNSLPVLTSGGESITWSYGSCGTNHAVIEGKVGGTSLIEISLNGGNQTVAGAVDKVSYSVKLLGPVDHADATTQDVRDISVGVTIDDGVSTGRGTLTVSIEDDAPEAGTIVKTTGVETVFNANVMISLDISTSMDNPSGIGNMTRLAAAKQAIISLLNGYKETLNEADSGDVKVNLSLFGTESRQLSAGWVSLDAAINLINTFTRPSGTQYTNYDAALQELIDSFNPLEYGANKPVDAAGTQNVSYFLSDGEPTKSNINPDNSNYYTTDPRLGDGIGRGSAFGFDPNSINGKSDVGQKNWEDFLTKYGVTSYAIGMGNVSKTYLDPIAYDGAAKTDNNSQLTKVVTDMSQLSNVLLGTTPKVEQVGGYLGAHSDSKAAGFGGDGGHVLTISVDGIVYTYDVVKHTISTSGGSTISGDTLKLTTALGGL
ncbi:Ig-like domain repeat protein [Aeromonas caviae]|nr:Ig-like domain repeat protein [Aeromonas caviae]